MYFDTKRSRFCVAGSAMAAILEFYMFISQPFQELKGWNLEFKLITPKLISGTHFETNLSRFGLAGLPLAPILDHFGIISGPFPDYFRRYRQSKLDVKFVMDRWRTASSVILDGHLRQTCQTKPTHIGLEIGPSNRFWGNELKLW